MFQLYLLRHAKSDWGADFDRDHDRPLSKRGRRAAALMGRFLATIGEVPELVISSTAVRALDTAERAAAAGEWPAPIHATPDLYGAAPALVLEVIRAQPDDLTRLLLVGHEPTWSETVGGLAGHADVRFPTAAVARIDFDFGSWSEADFGQGWIVWLVTPKLLAATGFE